MAIIDQEDGSFNGIPYTKIFTSLADIPNLPINTAALRAVAGMKQIVIWKDADGVVGNPLQPPSINQVSTTTIQVNDVLPKTSYPSGTVNTGHRVALTGTGTLHATYGTITGLAKNDVIEKTATVWIISKAAVDIQNNSLIRNARNGKHYTLDKSVGVDTYKPVGAGDLGRMMYIDVREGVDESTHGELNTPVQTLEHAETRMDGSGWRAQLLPGTHGIGAAITLNKQNIVYQGGTGNGNIVFNYLPTLSNPASNIHMVGLSFPLGLISNSPGTNYLTNCITGTGVTISKTGSGYLQMTDTVTESSIVSITGTGVTVIEGGTVGLLTINNAGAQASIRNAGRVVQPNILAGVLVIDGATIYATSNGGFAINTVANTFVFLYNCKFANPNGTLAKVNIQGFYMMGAGCQYLETGSTINKANNLGYISHFDAIKTVGMIESGSGFKGDWSQTAIGGYKAGSYVLKLDSTDSKYYFERAKADIAYNTAWNATLWDRVGSGSGGGTTVTNPRFAVVAVADASETTSITWGDGDKVALWNVADILPYWNVAVAIEEGDVIIYRSTTSDWGLHVDVSTAITTTGTYQITDSDGYIWYFDVQRTKWRKILADEYEEVTMTGGFTRNFAGNRSSVGGQNTFKQVTFGSTENVGAPVDFGADGNQIIKTVYDGGRAVSFNLAGNSLEMQVGTITGDNIVYGSEIAVGSCFFFDAFASPTGGVVTVEASSVTTRGVIIRLFNWNGSAYIQSATATHEATSLGMTEFKACLNANNTLEIIYRVFNGATKRAGAFIGNSTIDTSGDFQPVTLGAGSIGLQGCFTFGVTGRSVLLYRDGSNVLTAKGFTRNTNGTYTNESGVITFNVGNNNQDRINHTSKDGQLLLTYWFNNTSYCRWLNGSSATMTAGAESLIYYGDAYIFPVMGANYQQGTALVKLSSDGKPQTIGWVKSGDSIALAYPSLIAGSRVTFEAANGASIVFTGTKYLWSITGELNSGMAPPDRPQSGFITYTASDLVVPDFIMQDTGADGDFCRIAKNRNVSRGHSDSENGVVFYFESGAITRNVTPYQAGMGMGNGNIFVDIRDLSRIVALEETVDNHTTALATQSSTLTSQGNRITALENTSGQKVGWRFPDFASGWGMAMVYNDGIRDNTIGGGSNSQYRGFGDLENDGLITQHHIDFNGNVADENAFTGFAEIRYNTRNGVARSHEGKFFMFGRENQFGQLGEGTTAGTAVNGRAGKWVLQTQADVYGANLFVTKVDISEDWWGDDTTRCTLMVTVRNTSTNVYNAYMRGYSSDSTGDTWCIISSGNATPGNTPASTPVKGYVTAWTKIFANPANVIQASLGVEYAHIIVDEGANKRLMFSGFNRNGCSGTNDSINAVTTSYKTCLYDTGLPVLDAKWVKSIWSSTATCTVYMINTAGKPFSCGYQGYYNAGFGATANEFRFKAMLTGFIANRQVTKIIALRLSVAVLLDNDDLYFAGFSQNYMGTNGTSNFKNGANADIVNGVPVVLAASYQTPVLMASGVDKVWSNAPRGQFNDDFLYYRRRATKEVLYTGYAFNNTSLADNSNDTATNYARVVNKPSAGEWIEDLHVDGGKTDSGQWYHVTTVITNKGNVYRAGYEVLGGKTSTIDRILKKWKRVLAEYETK